MRFRDFGSPVSNDEPVVFRMYGRDFTCAPAVQGRLLINLFQAEEDGVAAQTAAVVEFLKHVMIPEDWKRFDAMSTSSTHIVGIDNIAAVMEWLVSVYSGERPTQESSDS